MEYITYEAWLERDGLPLEKAMKILENPAGFQKKFLSIFRIFQE